MRKVCVFCVLPLLALPGASADAGTLYGTPESIGYVAAAGEANDVTIALDDGAVTVRDPGAVIQLDVGNERCTLSPDGHTATCPADGVTSVGGSLGDGDDQGRIGPVALTVSMSGGEGNDLVEGTGERVTLRGGGGNDLLTAIGAVNSLEGEDGDDVMTGDS